MVDRIMSALNAMTVRMPTSSAALAKVRPRLVRESPLTQPFMTHDRIVRISGAMAVGSLSRRLQLDETDRGWLG